MHATPKRRIGTRAAGLLAAPLLLLTAAGCTSSKSGDPGAVNLPSKSATTLPSALDGGPIVTFTGDTPEVAGHYPATQALAKAAGSLPSNCQPSLERSDPHLVSIAWKCGSKLSAATVTLGGDTLALDAILKGGYEGYLSSVAQQQFSIQGDRKADTSAFSAWYLTPAALSVVYADGVVTYPLASLKAYLRDASGL